jgi:Helix-turn-helix
VVDGSNAFTLLMPSMATRLLFANVRGWKISDGRCRNCFGFLITWQPISYHTFGGFALKCPPENEPFDLASALEELGWSQAELARRLGLHVNTVSAWATKRTEIPGPVRAYLDLRLKLLRLCRSV